MGLDVDNVCDRTDVLVIGSGFGGSVVAARLAKAGYGVCVLERGKAYPPGSFPRGRDLLTNFWNPPRRYGLFEYHRFSNINAIVSSGLGGGSLIYANVMLPMQPEWFRQPVPGGGGAEEKWSFTYDDLAPHYWDVASFLKVQELPTWRADFHLPKTTAFLKAADGQGHIAPLAVRFLGADGQPADGAELPPSDYGNIFGAERTTCQLIGECDVGCNVGAKNSLDHTYLSLAHHHGASIHQLTEVRDIRCRAGDPDGYLFDVSVVVHAPDGNEGDSRAAAPTSKVIRAKRVVVSAGTLGSTRLLLRNAGSLGLDNPALGTRFCGNGDLLGFVTNTASHLRAGRGPVITAYQRHPDRVETGAAADHGMYVEDGGYPGFLAPLIGLAQENPALGEALIESLAPDDYMGVGTPEQLSPIDIIKAVRRVLSAGALPLLGMGRDTPDGHLSLSADRLECCWSMDGSDSYFDSLYERMGTLATAMGGTFCVNPTYWARRLITVHPLGGCPADTTAKRGVVDQYGHVRGVPGLRVCDGSILPGPTGANPSLTIAAFANRVATQMIQEGLPRVAPDAEPYSET